MTADRQYPVASLIFDFVKSPSLRHLRDQHSVQKLAKDILSAVDRRSPVWSKWEADREETAKAAAWCWIPIGDLLSCLNDLPGPPLTKSDVEQRLRAIREEPYTNCFDDSLEEGCLAIYCAEKAEGTEMHAILGVLQEHLEREDNRLRQDREESHRRWRKEEQANLETVHSRCRLRMDEGRQVRGFILPKERPDLPDRAGQGQVMELVPGERRRR